VVPPITLLLIVPPLIVAVFMVGDVNVLLVSVCDAAIVTKVSVPDMFGTFNVDCPALVCKGVIIISVSVEAFMKSNENFLVKSRESVMYGFINVEDSPTVPAPAGPV